jgi:hypothetical protein
LPEIPFTRLLRHGRIKIDASYLEADGKVTTPTPLHVLSLQTPNAISADLQASFLGDANPELVIIRKSGRAFQILSGYEIDPSKVNGTVLDYPGPSFIQMLLPRDEKIIEFELF